MCFFSAQKNSQKTNYCTFEKKYYNFIFFGHILVVDEESLVNDNTLGGGGFVE
jgi:hypothetical protein